MTSPDNLDHLTQIETINTLIEEGNKQDTLAVEARRQLVMLYYGSAYRYLLGCLRDQEAAQELAQNFAIRLLQGEYIKHADPDKGRFRDYLKRSLQNLVIDYQRRKKGPQTLPEDSGAYSPREEQHFESDEAFLTSLREELVSCTWKSLEAYEKETHTPYETVLRMKTEQPKWRSVKIAEELTKKLGKPYNEQGVRKILQRSRDKFADLLLDHVQRSLQAYEPTALEEQLVELGLLEFCKSALDKRRQQQ